MSGLAALLFALLKAVPEFRAVMDEVLAAYSAWKKQQNIADETKTNARADDAVDRAVAAQPKLCDTCPYAAHKPA